MNQLYGKEGGDYILGLTGATAPSTSAIQAALARRSRLGLVDEGDNDWRFTDSLFEAWVRERPASEF